ncbi:hypothetical protein SADUNF_Sadunf16G0092700 [Salix dunnii]|uniref:Uncharacterized protein n=1 Tax=Salix dunnii TaxID=1413687 RepID=A0A835J995_9ROSI|nr:hypothetical protein SADUNF_Sadunf16G0092700 [Salix dunnii]
MCLQNKITSCKHAFIQVSSPKMFKRNTLSINGKPFMNYYIIMMTRSYSSILMYNNSSISYFTCLIIYFSLISLGCTCACSTYHYWRTSNPLHYIIGIAMSSYVGKIKASWRMFIAFTGLVDILTQMLEPLQGSS